MVNNRKGIGGRKAVVLPNPFIAVDAWGDEVNILWDTESDLDIRIEDTLVGCVRSWDASSTKRQATVNWQKLLRCYRHCEILSRPVIEKYLLCSKAQATRYMQLIKFTNPFIERILNSKTSVRGYISITHSQAQNGYLEIL